MQRSTEREAGGDRQRDRDSDMQIGRGREEDGLHETTIYRGGAHRVLSAEE